jgi:outer membrane protein assembly factor BamB
MRHATSICPFPAFPKTILFLLVLFFFSGEISAIEPLWSRALAGETVAGPIAFGNRVYVAGSDRTVTCLSSLGAFLWSKMLPGKPAPFMTVTGEGTVYAVTEPGTITAFNADGSLLWQLKGKTLPLFAPMEGRDGRFFLVYPDRIVCASITGAVKWTLPLPSLPVLPLSETGEGDLILSCAGGLLLRISPFGEILEKTAEQQTVSAFSAVPGGYAAGYRSGIIRYFDVRTKSEALWQFNAYSPCLALGWGEGTLVALQADGSLYGLNSTDGSLLWSASSGKPVTGEPFLRYDFGEFITAFEGTASGRSSSGRSVWQAELPETLHNPVVSEAGILYGSTPD